MWISCLDIYADDSTRSTSDKTVEDLECKLNPDMNVVDVWHNKNRIATDGTKTKPMLMTHPTKKTHLTITHLSVSCNANPLENMVSETLGV